MDASPAPTAPPAPDAVTRLAPEVFAERARAIEAEVGKVIVGQRELVRHTLVALLANSRALLEGVPGLGKTMLSGRSATSSTARSTGSSSRRT